MRVLVPEAHAMGSIACIRSLGRAGHSIIAMSDHPDALGFQSVYCSDTVLMPPGIDGAKFKLLVLRLIQDRDIDLVLPSENLILALGNDLPRIAEKLPCGPDASRLLRYVNKYELFDHFLRSDDRTLRDHLPATVLFEDGDSLSDKLSDVDGPVFAKLDASNGGSLPARVMRFQTTPEAISTLNAVAAAYGRGLVQAEVPGRGVGVFFLRWHGQVLASLMHRRLHEVPHTGGVSSLRETWWDEELYDDARRRIESIDWWGVGMLEYRYAGPGRFHLMEFNARFWGSLHLALNADVDFPLLLLNAWSGQPVAREIRARTGVCCRWTFPKEVEYLASLLRDRRVSALQKLNAALDALTLSLDPRVKSDLWFAGDRRLYWTALKRTPGRLLRRK
jgi:hypothetical protein